MIIILILLYLILGILIQYDYYFNIGHSHPI